MEQDTLLRFKRFDVILPEGCRLCGEGIIDDMQQTIYVTIPEHLDKSQLIVKFDVEEGIQVRCNGILQESGVTGNDFEQNQMYELRKGSIKTTYRVIVGDWKGIPGYAYEGDSLQRPERPYQHDYTKTLMMKLDLAIPGPQPNTTHLFLNLDETLELIKQIDVMTRHMPKIIYLVGWQYNGHDDQYPAFFKVNPALKREQDQDARRSLIWLMDEAFKYHTCVSLHINMTDAYQDSILWQTYTEEGLISQKEDGTLMDIGEWGIYIKKTAYQVNYTAEWASGFAKKRIDTLIRLLPIQRAGTIHIDAFFARASKTTTLEEEQIAKRKICRYWRECGIDVTTEFLHGIDKNTNQESYYGGQGSGVIGIIPCIWHFNQSKEDYMKRPAHLVTGAGINKDLPFGKDTQIPFLFGTSMYGEDLFIDRQKGYGLHPKWREHFIDSFCTRTLLWSYQNQFERLHLDEKRNVLTYSDGLVADFDAQKIVHKDMIIKEQNDVFVPLVWQDQKEVIAFSLYGYVDKEWSVPQCWQEASRVEVYEMLEDGLRKISECIITETRKIMLTLKPKQMVLLMPIDDSSLEGNID